MPQGNPSSDKMLLNFDALIGNQDLKEQLEDTLFIFITKKEEWIAYLKGINSYAASAILLFGLPGLGKTSILRAIEASIKPMDDIGVRFYKSNEFQGQVGNNGQKISEAFDGARASKQSTFVMLIDEIDGVMQKKEGLLNVQERTNAFQAEIEGMVDSTKLIIIGTTNHTESIEPAALDRFVSIQIKPPNLNERKIFIAKYLSVIKFDKPLDVDLLAVHTDGMTGRHFTQISKRLKMFELRHGEVPLGNLSLELIKYSGRAGKNKKAIIEGENNDY